MSVPSGYIYALSNAAQPGLYKIGASTNHPYKRAKQLSASTASALPFQVVAFRRIASPFTAEAELHRALDGFRVNEGREFFRCPLSHILVLMEDYPEMPESIDTNDYPFAQLFATFEDDGSPRTLNAEEQAKCRELERRIYAD